MAGTRAELYEISDLRMQRGGSGARFELHVPNLTVRAGAAVLVEGVSGSGKSTLLDLLALALPPDHALQFQFNPRPDVRADLNTLWLSRALDQLGWLRGEHIGYVLQTGGLLPFLTVGENIALPCRLLGRRADAAPELAERLGISSQLKKWPGELSVGERQRAAIARALVHRPSLILADEPTASVDPLNAEAIFTLLLELVIRFGATAIIATHDVGRRASLPTLQHRLERYGGLTRSLFWS